MPHSVVQASRGGVVSPIRPMELSISLTREQIKNMKKRFLARPIEDHDGIADYPGLPKRNDRVGFDHFTWRASRIETSAIPWRPGAEG